MCVSYSKVWFRTNERFIGQAWLCSCWPVIAAEFCLFNQTTYYVYCILCVVTVDLGILSSADRWAQLWTRMDGYACMYAQVNTSCLCAPDCGMFAFSTKGLILLNVWPLVVMSTCMARMNDTVRMFSILELCLLVFQVCAPWMHCTHVCIG